MCIKIYNEHETTSVMSVSYVVFKLSYDYYILHNHAGRCAPPSNLSLPCIYYSRDPSKERFVTIYQRIGQVQGV